ncbi:glycosyltransferase family 2 protein [Agaribacter marinus]|uniref:Rhamnosyltransferase n=1 Tax=Agaribacter marinus TaxID=1431249 RepID=A0AA37SYV8_9ALTE|nr:glycosyltransferase family 2 protein [Agaribacter marinus]GLR70854.1 rhamnosyltransferase [Agaribacter marinus]
MHSVGAIIVLYYPDCEHVARMLIALRDSVDYMILVDNSETASQLNLCPNAYYMHMGSNVGIAAAQNRGLKRLLELSCDYAFLFDQDSTISVNFIRDMLNAFFSSTDETLAAIGPQVVCNYIGKNEQPKLQKPYRHVGNFQYVRQIISSGMLIDLDKLKKVGMKEEDLFIDGVDHEWCWRAATLDYSVAITSKVEMNHQMGIERKNFLGISYKVGQAIRHYYQVRNILLLMRRPYVPMYWKLRNSAMIVLRLILVILQGENKAARLKYMFLGFMDGLKGKKGKLGQYKKPV